MSTASRLTVKVLDNMSGTGDSTPVEWVGGEAEVTCAGTFNGKTITLKALCADGTTYAAAGSDTTFTAAGVGLFKLAAGTMVMATASGTVSGMYLHATRI